MARPQIYGEPMVMFNKRVPESHKEAIESLVCDYLNKIKPVVKLSVTDKMSKPVAKVAAKIKKIPVPKGQTTSLENVPSVHIFACGCSVSEGLLRKPKNSPCKLTKLEHETLK